MKKNQIKNGAICTFKTMEGNVTIDVSKYNVTDDEVKRFKLDLKRAEVAIKNKRRTLEEAALFIASKYPNHQDIFQVILAEELLSIAWNYEHREELNEYKLKRYNDTLKQMKSIQETLWMI